MIFMIYFGTICWVKGQEFTKTRTGYFYLFGSKMSKR
jgi:hypothetical protein